MTRVIKHTHLSSLKKTINGVPKSANLGVLHINSRIEEDIQSPFEFAGGTLKSEKMRFLPKFWV